MFEKALKQKGLKKGYVADKLFITPGMLSERLKDPSKFKPLEREKLEKLFNCNFSELFNKRS